MRVKTFRGPDAKTVLGRIKKELGSDSVILSTKNYKEDGESICEITAALEDHRKPAPSQASQAQTSADPVAGVAPGWGQWHQEWQSIKEHITALIKPQLDLARLSPRQRLAMEYLDREGVSGAVMMELFRGLKDDMQATVLAPLERLVRVSAWSAEHWKQTFHALAGPSGTGKTSGIVRMAAILRQQNPATRIRLVNMDCARSNGRLLLKHYAELSRLDYMEIRTPADVTRMIEDGESYDYVLLDLPAMDRSMTLERLTDRHGLTKIPDLRVHIVLSPHFSTVQLSAFERRFYSPSASSVIWTKLDEAYNYGAIINVAADTGLPVSAMSSGAGLTGTLVPASHTLIWRLIFKHQLPSEQTND